MRESHDNGTARSFCSSPEYDEKWKGLPHEDEFDLSGPGGSMLGRKICEQRIRGEGMPVKGASVVRLLRHSLVTLSSQRLSVSASVVCSDVMRPTGV